MARLKPTVVLQPLEPPQLRVTLVPHDDASRRPDSHRGGQPARVDLRASPGRGRPRAAAPGKDGGRSCPSWSRAAAAQRRRTRWRSVSTPPAPAATWVISLCATIGTWGLTGNCATWAFGNRALIRQRRAEYDTGPFPAIPLSAMWWPRKSRRPGPTCVPRERRMEAVLRELRQAELFGPAEPGCMAEIKRVGGGINILVIRPLEVVAALQALATAYFDYYGVMADYNRAQFRCIVPSAVPAQAIAGTTASAVRRFCPRCRELASPAMAVSAPPPAKAPQKAKRRRRHPVSDLAGKQGPGSSCRAPPCPRRCPVSSRDRPPRPCVSRAMRSAPTGHGFIQDGGRRLFGKVDARLHDRLRQPAERWPRFQDRSRHCGVAARRSSWPHARRDAERPRPA